MKSTVYYAVMGLSIFNYSMLIFSMENRERLSSKSSTEQALEDIKVSREEVQGRQLTRDESLTLFQKSEDLLHRYEMRTLDRKLTEAEKERAIKIHKEMFLNTPIVQISTTVVKKKHACSLVCNFCKKIKFKRKEKNDT